MDARGYYVYQLEDADGVPFYVGAASTESRARLHLSRAKRGIGGEVGQKIRDLEYVFRLQKLVEGVNRVTAQEFERRLIENDPRMSDQNAGGGGPALGWRHSPEAREKITAANLGLKKDAATRAKIASRARERKHSPERLAKFSETVECPHCGAVGGRAGMQRWHFNRCPSRS